ncbi:probable RNA-binding protein 18 [Athene cunicularia]|uniref:probable RNA-binding protein 18 n=1 Tax=Athene cunicularia TaxID=194338 RepID=UPI000EF7084D|nr:probable RNA-binding protein 18 [Athene cunicularia]
MVRSIDFSPGRSRLRGVIAAAALLCLELTGSPGPSGPGKLPPPATEGTGLCRSEDGPGGTNPRARARWAAGSSASFGTGRGIRRFLSIPPTFRVVKGIIKVSSLPFRYHLLKLLQKFGKVKQFDFLFHKSGALEGQPRGYCFVNFETKQEAEKAIQCLNGKLALSKKLVVRWAHAQVKRYDHNKNEKILPISLEPSSSTEPPQSNLSVSAKIKAIEAKLKMMAENPDAEYPAAPVYSYFKPPDKKRTTPYSRAAWKSRR